ncbi:translation initiation factor IF-2-like isoform X2 [Choloepus didactylus]|uniref:translation initiation factor IF-2-like isoform X2 n=1 Tax=Choloepus didactylus TaxID=27675 RepID=UPI00189E6008|nr:translation initiation factor IF-2-like isoform X2 [Choloepus didactylus]
MVTIVSVAAAALRGPPAAGPTTGRGCPDSALRPRGGCSAPGRGAGGARERPRGTEAPPAARPRAPLCSRPALAPPRVALQSPARPPSPFTSPGTRGEKRAGVVARFPSWENCGPGGGVTGSRPESRARAGTQVCCVQPAPPADVKVAGGRGGRPSRAPCLSGPRRVSRSRGQLPGPSPSPRVVLSLGRLRPGSGKGRPSRWVGAWGSGDGLVDDSPAPLGLKKYLPCLQSPETQLSAL